MGILHPHAYQPGKSFRAVKMTHGESLMCRVCGNGAHANHSGTSCGAGQADPTNKSGRCNRLQSTADKVWCESATSRETIGLKPASASRLRVAPSRDYLLCSLRTLYIKLRPWHPRPILQF